MSEIQKLNKTFQEDQILDSSEMNSITSKIDEVIENLNNNENNPSVGNIINDAPSDGKVYGRKNKDWKEINDVIIIEGLLDLIDTGTVTSENLNTIFGVSTFSGISAKIKDKILLTKSNYIPGAVITSVCSGSEDASIIVLTSIIMGNAFSFTLNFNNDILSKSSIKTTQLVEDAPSDRYTYGRSDGKWVKIKRDYEHTLYVLDLTNSSSVEDIRRIVGSPQNLIDLASRYNLYTGLYAYGIDSIPIHVTYNSTGTVLIECSYIKPASTFLVATRITLQYIDNTWTGCFVDTNDK